MEHSFDVGAAERYGVDEAIILRALVFWIKKNKSNGRHQHEVEVEGKKVTRTWTYNSAAAWSKIFPYWTQWQVERILLSLKKQGVVLTGHFAEESFDRSLWYALVDEEGWVGERETGHMDLVKPPNGLGETTECTTVTSTADEDKERLSKDSRRDAGTASQSRVPLRKNGVLKEGMRDLLVEALQLGEFTNKLPGEPVAKLYLEVQKFLALLPSPSELARAYEWDSAWMSQNNIDLRWFQGRAVEPLVRRACRRYATMRKEGWEPQKKQILTRYIQDFFYNAPQRKSWFLYCTFNEPHPVAGAGREITLTEDEKVLILEHKRHGWDEREYLVKAKNLLAWYKECAEGARVFNYQIRNSMTPWDDHFASFGSLLRTIDEYAKGWSDWTLGNFGRGNKTWARFLDWCRRQYNVELEPPPNRVKEAEELQRQSLAADEQREEE